jgi:hypothetical protein
MGFTQCHSSDFQALILLYSHKKKDASWVSFLKIQKVCTGVRHGVSKGVEEDRSPAAPPCRRPPLKRLYGCFRDGRPQGVERLGMAGS